jgi:hypothetical protein
MPKFLVTYHGGEGMPADPEARSQAMAAFGAWAQGAGRALVDPGAPLGPAKVVSRVGVTAERASSPASGYSVLQADTIDAAVGLVQNHPFILRGGSLEVSEAINP